VKPCGADADSISEHIINDVAHFIPNYNDKVLFSTHDGASAMIKVSTLLKVNNWNHCVAHALHLLVTTDAMKKVGNIMSLVQKCKTIVNTLHFKTEILEREVSITNDRNAATELLDKISHIKQLQDADAHIEVHDSGSESDNIDEPISADDGGMQSTGERDIEYVPQKKVHRLQNEVPMR